MSDRVCVVGCSRRDVHYSACPWDGVERGSDKAKALVDRDVPFCGGCAPGACRAGSVVCDTCFGRARALLADAPDLLGRLRALGDPSKSGWNWDRGEVVRSSSPHPPAPIGDDLLDAIHGVEAAVSFFPTDLTVVSNDVHAMGWLGPLVLDRHTPTADGTRAGWSVRDAVDRWGVESRERNVYPRALPNAPLGSFARSDEEEDPMRVTSWYDPLVSVQDAAHRRGVDERTARRWVEKGLLPHVMRVREGRRTQTVAHASAWFAIKPCPIAHRGAWCTLVDGHTDKCVTRPGERPEPTNHLNRTDEGEER